jgi:hypothetical protein
MADNMVVYTAVYNTSTARWPISTPSSSCMRSS